MLPQKIVRFRVSEMPSSGFSLGAFSIMRQKCSRKLFVLTVSLVISVSYSAGSERKKNTKTMKTGHKQRARRRPLRLANSFTNLSISTLLCLCILRIAKQLNLSSVIILRRRDFSLFMLLKLRPAVHVDTE